MRRAARPFVGLGAACALAVAGAAVAKSPDWSGIYAIARGEDLAGHKPIAPGDELDALVTAHLQPWAKAKMEATSTQADDTGAICQLAGLFRHPTTVAGFQWVIEPDKILMVSDDLQEVGVRRIRMTDRHPDNVPATWQGSSIGHWDGDTLVVDTIGFNDKSWLMSGMEPHTEELHVVERIRAVNGGALLEVATTVDDRKALTGPYAYSRYYKRVDHEFVESVCNGEPGEPQRWNGIRKAAIARQLSARGANAQGAAQ